MTKQTIKLKRHKDCKHSVRFAAEPPTDPAKQNAVDSVYVSRAMPGVNEAQTITVTIEVPLNFPQRLPVTLTKLSVCPCGFRLLDESIPLGTAYEIDPARTAQLTMICGGCHNELQLDGVYVYDRGNSQGGYLPDSVFSHKTQPNENDSITQTE